MSVRGGGYRGNHKKIIERKKKLYEEAQKRLKNKGEGRGGLKSKPDVFKRPRRRGTSYH